MEGFLIRGSELILPGFGGTSALARGATLAERWRHQPQSFSNHPVGKPILPRVRWLHVRSPGNQRSASGTGVSTLFGAVSTRGITVFVPRLSELYL